MAFRLYLVPVVGTGATISTSRRPKYFTDGTIAVSPWSAMDYGSEPWMIVGADLSPTDDVLVVSKLDAFALPFDLTPLLTPLEVTAVQTKLEAINIPAEWVTTLLTWLEVARRVLGILTFMQRFTALNVNVSLFAGASLATTIGGLPVGVRNNLTSAAVGLSVDTGGVTGATTIRQALKLFVDQLDGQSYVFNGQVI